MNKDSLILKFVKNHSPRAIGDVVVFTTHDEKRTANWYLQNQIAVIDCGCDDPNVKSKCSDCDKKAAEKLAAEVAPAPIEIMAEPIVEIVEKPKKKGKK